MRSYWYPNGSFTHYQALTYYFSHCPVKLSVKSYDKTWLTRLQLGYHYATDRSLICRDFRVRTNQSVFAREATTTITAKSVKLLKMKSDGHIKCNNHRKRVCMSTTVVPYLSAEALLRGSVSSHLKETPLRAPVALLCTIRRVN